jgi:hypothetical protein
MSQLAHDHQLSRLREAEDCYLKIYRDWKWIMKQGGIPSLDDGDMAHIAWEMGCSDLYRRLCK